jgi:hypothetical protein
MTVKNGLKEKTNKCQVTNTPVNSAENWSRQMITSVPSVEKLTQLGLKDAQNVETRLKLDKSDAAAVA